MSEKKAVIMLSLVLLTLGILALYVYYFALQDFNFYKSEIKISENNIQETLYYIPNQDLRTLFRNFNAPVFYFKENIQNDFIKVNSVECEQGKAYLKDYEGIISIFINSKYSEGISYIPYTESNEYGCTFEDYTGFKKGAGYWTSSSYQINTNTLFYIKGKYYIKFVAYSSGRHHLLIKNKNFFVQGNAITKSVFLPTQQVDIYIPYEGDISGHQIISKFNFEFDGFGWFWLTILLAIFPLMSFLAVWHFFGKEKTFMDLPSTLSYFPNERKAWEVASFFHPPFAVIDRDFFSSMLMSLYQRKIIDIKIINKKSHIKIIENNKIILDEIEKDFLEVLKKIKKEANPKYFSGEYFDLAHASAKLASNKEIIALYKILEKDIKKSSKQYINIRADWIFLFSGVGVLVLVDIISGIPQIFLNPFGIFYFISYLILCIIHKNSALLASYRADFYKEYQQWQAFRNYLKQFPSMKNSPPEAVKLWNQYLVYATALGVSKQVLKKFKEWKIIDDSQYYMFAYMHISSTAFSSSASSGTHSNSGGFGGGGGVGGGGGGGR